MAGARADGYRVNFIAVHWYGADFATSAAVRQLESYLRAIHARYHLPIWLTEFALIRFGATTVFPSARRQAAFVTAATSMLQRLRFVQRYAWFALPAIDWRRHRWPLQARCRGHSCRAGVRGGAVIGPVV